MKNIFLLLLTFISIFSLPVSKGRTYFLDKLKLNKIKQEFYLLNLSPLERYRVEYVIDGDTIVVYTGDHIRFLGMNTPELHSKNPQVRAMAYKAKAVTSRLVDKKIVFLSRDVQNTDKYGRLLRFVFLSAKDSHDITKSVNYYLVRNGYARVLTIPPNVAFKDVFLRAQAQARIEKKGLWSFVSTRK